MTDQEPKELTKDERIALAKTLFADVDTIDADLNEAQAMLADLATKKSAKIAEIAKTVGRGPFTVRGKQLYVTERQGVFALGEKRERKSLEIG